MRSYAVAEKVSAEEQILCASLLPMVESLVEQVLLRWPSLKADELLNAGRFAAVAAAKEYRAERGPVEPYAFAALRREIHSAARAQLATGEHASVAPDPWPLADIEVDEGMPRSAAMETDAPVVGGPSRDRAALVASLEIRAVHLLADDLLRDHQPEQDDQEDQQRLERSIAILRRAARSLLEPKPAYFRVRYEERRSTNEVIEALVLSEPELRRLSLRVATELARALKGPERPSLR
ncbi:MAG: hypothetical protein HOW73_28620 [Polyangiaceae bacterium]|nr:hypothetical protein [Polyangiaceae bacterium]